MFESLAEKLQITFKKLSGQGKLTEANISEAMREVRLALLEADVNYKVARDFIDLVKQRALGQEVLRSLTPELQVVKIVSDELTKLMGESVSRLDIAPSGPTILMLVGLQGSGKTTAAGKLALRFKKEGRSPILVAADVYRPAAVKQLQLLGDQVGVPTFSMGTNISPVAICQDALKYATTHNHNIMIVDTAGRLHINEELMTELDQIKKAINPTEILLVADAMTGQDAVKIAEEFNRRLQINGVILTKLDGDARGGAALSIRAVTQKPIKFVGVGEKLDALEEFHPDRIASRILGRGDLLSLIEKAEAAIDLEKAKALEKKLGKEGLDFEDFLDQLHQIKGMGSLDQLLEMIPGVGSLGKMKGLQADESQLKRSEAIVYSMTPKERKEPKLINGSRRLRIAKGSGTSVQDVNRLIKQLDQMNKMMKQFTKSGSKKGNRMRQFFQFS